MSGDSDPILEFRAVSKWYDSAPERKILDKVDLQLSAGDRVSIVGPSGCGKSTLLNLLGTLDSPCEGEIIVGGQSTGSLSEGELSDLRARHFGFIFQMHHLLPQCTALENVVVPTLALRDRPDAKETADKAGHLLDRVGLGGKENSHPAQLSGGERQRVAVVRALINSPRLLLADEPTGALDEDNAERLVDLLSELNRTEGLALIVVTHDLDIAHSIGSIQTLRQGQLIDTNTPTS